MKTRFTGIGEGVAEEVAHFERSGGGLPPLIMPPGLNGSFGSPEPFLPNLLPASPPHATKIAAAPIPPTAYFVQRIPRCRAITRPTARARDDRKFRRLCLARRRDLGHRRPSLSMW